MRTHIPTRREPPEEPPFRLPAVRGSRPRAGIDLDCPRALDAEDDEATFARPLRSPLPAGEG